MTFRKLAVLTLAILLVGSLPAQQPKTYHSGEVKQLLKKLNVLGTVLYVAAHPDDENTAIISYFANESLYRTAYLSATRGDGGQNLIGPEIREQLGVIRTQELLAARRQDGGRQFFSRANDFGYSKNSAETQEIWNREEVLSDFVRVYRQFRPDVIVTRFTAELGGHGHHLTSAILAREAYNLSGDAEAYPEQLDLMDPWQPKKLFWNTSWWFYRFRGQEMDTTGLVSVDIGKYNALLGKSYTEISALSRSQHKSQGFGSSGSRGSRMEYLEQFEGEDTGDLFGGIDTSWKRVPGSEQVAEYLAMAEYNYDPENPSETIQALIAAKRALGKLEDQFWKEIKLKEIDEAIRVVAGIYLEVASNDHSYVPGDSIQLNVEAVSRLGDGFTLKELRLEPWGKRFELGVALKANDRYSQDMVLKIDESMAVSQPYWLRAESSLGMYTVADPSLIGKPENPAAFRASFTLEIDGQYLDYETDVVFKKTDPVKGEVYRPVAVSPPVMATLDEQVLVFSNGISKKIDVKVQAGKAGVTGNISLDVPEGWTVTPSSTAFELEVKGEERTYAFEIVPPQGADIGTLRAVATLADGSSYSKGIEVIEYDHIPTQTLFPESVVRLVKLDLEKAGKRIGYIEGAGDLIPQNLEQIGFTVDVLDKDDITPEQLAGYDAVVLGVRAFNTVSWLSYKNQVLFDYAEQGGTVIVQYNTNRRLVTNDIAPYSVTLSRDRVTVEEAEVRVLAEDHPALNFPNKITPADFDGWVQERGLYFANEWAEEFTPILSSNDPGETPKDGGLLVAKHGKGYYVVSGYSWFRELPAGVPGAYRLFVNLLSLSASAPSN